jgi:cytochrome bd-type quinol oxidase subunit 1
LSTVDLARVQFASTSIYHFLFVPLTIGLSLLTALLQTSWHRSGRAEYLRLTRFFGTLLVINVAVGVVTGLVQEFQFGMNWSTYSRFVGDVFGAPLAMEGLAAFFLESTFLGLWIFGWDRLPKRVHLATIWAVAVGAALSAAFIMAANSWMQHPVGYTINRQLDRAQLTDIWAVLSNPVFVWGYLHVMLASAVTGSVVMLAVSAWHLRRGFEVSVFRRAMTLALVVLVPTALFAVMVGGRLGVVETKYQPMKITAAEAQWTTCQPCSFSLFQIGGGSQDKTPTKIIAVPHLLSLLATDSWNGKVTGLNELNSQYQSQFGPGDYVPNVFIQYWSMRAMAYIGGAVLLLALWGIWLLWRKRVESAQWFLRASIWAVVLPFVMNTAGWMLTENGRQPWIVQGLQLTRQGVSPSVSTTSVVISLCVFILLYGALAVVDWALMLRYSRKQLDPIPDQPDEQRVAMAATHY